MAFNGFLRRASSSLMLRRPPYHTEIFAPNKVGNSSLRLVIGRQFPPSVRFLTGFVDKTTPQTKAVEETLSLVKAPPPKKAAKGTSHDDGLGFVVTSGPRKGMLTLLRKGQDEIIRIDVKAYDNVMDFYDDECNYEDDDHGPMKSPFTELDIDSEKMNNPEKVVDYNPCLHLQINIYHGHMYRKCVTFNTLALADCPDKLLIRQMYASASVLGYGQGPHLEGFDDFLKARGIEPGIMNSFFDSS